MASGYYLYEEEWEEDWWVDTAPEPLASYGSMPVVIASIVLVLLIAATLIWAASSLDNSAAANSTVQPARVLPDTAVGEADVRLSPPLPGASTVIAPYDNYIITQGVHGLSYGHLAIDIAAGKGAAIKAPISGVVSEQYVDGVGNPTLVIENEKYKVTLLHGIYTVKLGDTIGIGEVIGSESNIGNTRDMQGQSCRGRDCGYHTHLNIFDKAAGANVNPLDVIGN